MDLHFLLDLKKNIFRHHMQGDDSADLRARARALLFEEHTRHPDAVPLRVFQGSAYCHVLNKQTNAFVPFTVPIALTQLRVVRVNSQSCHSQPKTVMLCYIVQSPNCNATLPGVSPEDSVFSAV